MDTPGSILKTEREKQNTSLKEIADSLKLNIQYLKAIENEEYHLIPAEIYTKAYLRFYAQALGLDSEFIIGLYQKQMNASAVQKPLPSEKKSSIPSGAVFVVTSLVVAALVLFILTRRTESPVETVQGTKGSEAAKPEESKMNEGPVVLKEPAATEPSVETAQGTKGPEAAKTEESKMNEEPAGLKEPAATDTKKQETPKQQETAAPLEHKELTLKIIATDTTWLAAEIDGGKPKEWLLKKGEAISLSASEKFVIKTGNAGGTKIVFNGEDIGALGEQGQVAELVLPKEKSE
jgi:cytoskeletal protein RodZ